MYSTHFKLNFEDIPHYVEEKLHFFGKTEGLEIKELSDGNINYVYKIIDQESNRSLILKQADVVLRSSGRPLDVKRSEIEATMLQIQHKLAPEMIPEVYFYDQVMSVTFMEDVSEFKNFRYEMMDRQVFPSFHKQIISYFSKTALGTTDLILNRAEKKANVAKFTNVELCDISEDLVFTEPFNNYKGRNIITQGNEEYVNEHIYSNNQLVSEAMKLRYNFMNNAQALIHGDLHSGSIFINHNGIKVLDPEFAFYGPIGYDIGNVIAHLVMPAMVCQVTDEESETKDNFINWVASTVPAILYGFEREFKKAYLATVQEDVAKNEMFVEWYTRQIVADAKGYAGLEIIRRVIGDTKVKELETIQDSQQRIAVERKLIELASSLIINRDVNGQDLHSLLSALNG
ncbi:S-methyl-5-thioribose kinase [Vibrio scophthalmi]|uniref:S-methyl-5-thioribose kinase n=1 Tax=Vibrio scophthalmi LMG 19158 TaxID=870967 RepID=F9RS13_9VIBR|nr:S-methyl-5-thioribose kinase [Vibrio scophthalmi]EGU32625.1 methylthioribose kinase [Vibrio scophthalmi LMG 19158]